MSGQQTGAGHIAKADLHDGRFGRKGRKGKEKKKTWFAIREVHHRIVPCSCNPYSLILKASGNLGAKPLEITLHSGLRFLAAPRIPDTDIVLLE